MSAVNPELSGSGAGPLGGSMAESQPGWGHICGAALCSHSSRIHSLCVACQFFVFLFNKMIFMCSYKTSLSTQVSRDFFLGNEQFLITQVIVLTELFLPLPS